ncbi:MAG: hypothetical protein M1546_11375 [Chloroflexi bacterium]|nr:hypothetical protein [Chloroflexota bacterium]
MKWIPLTILVCIAAAAITLAAGYAGAGITAGWLAFILAGAVWMTIHHYTRWREGDTLGWIAFTAAAAVGLLIQRSSALMLAGVLMALIAWDLTSLDWRFRSAQRTEHTERLVRNHVRTLAFTLIGAGLIILPAMMVRVEFGFVPVLVLGALALLLLNRAIRALRS